MSLESIYYVSQIVSVVVVIASLVYLSLQVRQTERNQRALIQQGRANRVSDAVMRTSEPDISALFHKGSRSPAELTREEVDRFTLLSRAVFISAENSFLQRKAGLLDEPAYQSFVAGAKGMLGGSPGLRAAWRISRAQFGGDFAAFMNKTLAEVAGQPPAERFEQWQAAVKEDAA